MDDVIDKNSSHRSLTLSSCLEPARNQQIVADWLQRLQREGFAHSISSASLVEANGDEAELAIEVQEFLPEEEIIVIDPGNSKATGISKLLSLKSNPVEPTPQQSSLRRLPDPDLDSMSYELQQAYRILRELMTDSNKSFVGPFLNPVDSTAPGCLDYYDRIKRPMWMKRMHEKFLNSSYRTITEFVSDVRLMLENCYRFNGPDHSISRKAQRMETLLEQKLALLSRELRDKTSRIATSGRGGLGSLQSGSRRLKANAPHDSTALLNELRRQQALQDREKRRKQMMEKRQHYEAFLFSLQSWEESLMDEPIKSHMRSMWEIPQTCLLLVLCAVPLGLSEVSVYEFELSFLMPKESSMFQRLMTSLLSTPHQRIRLDSKPLMPYRVWNERLTLLVRHWYKVLNDLKRDVVQTCAKLGLEEQVFKVLGLTNPLDYRPFHELSLYQKVWIVKALCDHCVETQKCLGETIELQPSADHRALLLGMDSSGYSYIHFPQFCGNDLRIYRQKFKEKSEKESHKTKRSNRRRTKHKLKRTGTGSSKSASRLPTSTVPSPSAALLAAQRARDSRLRQNPRQVLSFQGETPADSGSPDDNDNDSSHDSESSSSEIEEVIHTPIKVESPPHTVKKLNESVTASSPQDDSTAVEGSAILRRSLRKIIEESKKDAVSPGSPSKSDLAATKRALARKVTPLKNRTQPSSKIPLQSPVHNGTSQSDSKYSKKTDTKSVPNSVVDMDVDEVDCSGMSSVSSVDMTTKQHPQCAISTSVTADADLSNILGESESNSMDSEAAGLELSVKRKALEAKIGNVMKNGLLSENNGKVEKYSASREPYTGNIDERIVGTTLHVDNELDRDPKKLKTCEELLEKGDVDNKVVRTSVDSIAASSVVSGSGSNAVSKAEQSGFDGVCNGKTTLDTETGQLKSELLPMMTIESDIKKESFEIGSGDFLETTDSKPIEKSSDADETKESFQQLESTSEIIEKVKEEPPELLVPDCSEFELVADDIESLRKLVAKFAGCQQQSEVSSAGQNQKNESSSAPKGLSRNEVELYERLSGLLTELEPFEQKLIQLCKKMKIKMRKEQEHYVEEPPDKEQENDVWQTSDSEYSDNEKSIPSVANETNDSINQPFVDESGFGLRSSLRRRPPTSNANVVVNQSRKRRADQSEESFSAKRMKPDAHEGAKPSKGLTESSSSGTMVQPSGLTSKTNAAPVSKSPHRALLRIDQPNGTVCFIALDNVSDLSKLPVTSVIQHLMASQKMTFTQAPTSQRPARPHTSSSNLRPAQPQCLAPQDLKTTVSGMNADGTPVKKPKCSVEYGRRMSSPVLSDALSGLVADQRPATSLTSCANRVSTVAQPLSAFPTMTTSGAALHNSPVKSAIVSQLLALPILSSQRSAVSVPGVVSGSPKPEVPSVNSGIAALISAAMSAAATSPVVTCSSVRYSLAQNKSSLDTNNQTLVLVNQAAGPARPLMGPAVGRVSLPSSASTATNAINVRPNAMPMFVTLLPNQQPVVGMPQHNILPVNGASVSLTAVPAEVSRPLLTSPPTTKVLQLPSGVASVPARLQQLPRYAGSLTVRALLEGRITTDLLLSKDSDGSVVSTDSLSLAASSTNISVSSHHFAVLGSGSSSNVSFGGIQSTSATVASNASIAVSSNQASVIGVRPTVLSTAHQTFLSAAQVPLLVRSNTIPIQRLPLQANPVSVPVQRVRFASTAVGLPVQRFLQTGGSSQLARLELSAVAGGTDLKLLPDAIGNRVALQVVSASGGSQQSDVVHLLPVSAVSQLVTSCADLNAVSTGVLQSRLPGFLPRVVPNNTRTTTVMKSPITAMPNLNELNHSPPSHSTMSQHPISNQGFSSVTLKPQTLSNQSQHSMTPISSVPRGSHVTASGVMNSKSPSISFVLRASVGSKISSVLGVPGSPQAVPGTLQPSSSTPTTVARMSGQLQAPVTPTKFQIVSLPGAVRAREALQAAVTLGNLQTLGLPRALQTVVAQGAVPTVTTVRQLRPLTPAGKLQMASTPVSVPGVGSPVKLQTIVSPTSMQGSQSVLLLQSNNGVVQLIQVSPNSVRGPSLTAPRPAAQITHGSFLSGQTSVVASQCQSVTSATSSVALGSIRGASEEHAGDTLVQEEKIDRSTCLVDAANIFLMAANVMDHTTSTSLASSAGGEQTCSTPAESVN